MAGPIYKARLAKKRVRKAGDLATLLRKLWQAVLEAEDVLLSAQDPELCLKAVHALSQVSGQYAKLLEIGELEARVQSLEATLGQKGLV